MSADISCPHCGQMHRSGARFCPSTGKLLQPTAAGMQAPTPPSSGPSVPSPVTGGPPAAGMTGLLPSNQVLNQRYIIVERVGRGGMAAVYKVTDALQPGAIWAIKEMSDAALPPEEREYAVKSFEQEARLLQALQHPNLPKVVDAFTERGKHYLVMEFVPGRSLEAEIRARQQPVPERELLPWAFALCDVMSYLHNQNPKIIFRDLKPSNVMLTPQGQIKLIDFGIVRFFKPGKTRDTQALGTPGYCAPEATTGQTDERSDLYSLCVTLHQLLSKHDPASTIFNLPPLRAINPQVSNELERILMKGLNNQRDQRWRSMDEMRTELARLLHPMDRTAIHQTWQAPAGQYMGYGGPQAGMVGGYISPAGKAADFTPGEPSNPYPAVLPTMAAPAPPGGAQMQRSDTSRPTTRLLMVAAQLSPWQFALVILGFIVLLVAGTALLARPLEEMEFNWNRVPIIALFGVLGYAIYPRRGVVFLSHVILSFIMIATIWLVLGDQEYEIIWMVIAVVASGVIMELWVFFLPRIKGKAGDEAWVRELIWLVLMAVLGITVFFIILFDLDTGIDPLKWLLAAIFAVIGWFIGDFIHQFLLYKKTGLRVRR
jgi:predicted Ser/Thr protein kinase